MSGVLNGSFADLQINHKKLRHKTSFVHRLDSSKEPPSSPTSIFDAENLSGASEDSTQMSESWPLPPSNIPFRRSFPLRNISNSGQARFATISKIMLAGTDTTTPVLNGGPSKGLATIVEQNSNSTIRSTASDSTLPYPHSTSDLRSSIQASAPHLLMRGNSTDTNSSHSPRRRFSLSADDLLAIKHLYHRTLSNIESTVNNPTSSVPFDLHEDYIAPCRPLHCPPERLPRLHRATNRFERLLGLESNAMGSSRGILPRVRTAASNTNSTRPVSTNVFASHRIFSTPTEDSARQNPGIHPSESTHGAELVQHPLIVAIPGPRSSSLGKTEQGFPVTSCSRIRVRDGTSGLNQRLHENEPETIQYTRLQPLAQLARKVMMPRSKTRGVLLQRHRQVGGQWAPASNGGLRLEAIMPAAVASPSLPLLHLSKSANTIQVCRHKSTVSLRDNVPVIPRDDVGLPRNVTTDRTNEIHIEQAASAVVVPAPSPHQEGQNLCWRCHAAGIRDAINGLWKTSTSSLCWYCCGEQTREKDGGMAARGVRVNTGY